MSLIKIAIIILGTKSRRLKQIENRRRLLSTILPNCCSVLLLMMCVKQRVEKTNHPPSHKLKENPRKQ